MYKQKLARSRESNRLTLAQMCLVATSIKITLKLTE